MRYTCCTLCATHIPLAVVQRTGRSAAQRGGKGWAEGWAVPGRAPRTRVQRRLDGWEGRAPLVSSPLWHWSGPLEWTGHHRTSP